MSAIGTKQTWALALQMSAIGGKADIIQGKADIKKCPTDLTTRGGSETLLPYRQMSLKGSGDIAV